MSSPPGDLEARLRELAAQIVALDRLMTVQFKSVEDKITAQKVNVDTALTAQKEQTAAAFAASEQAITKSEEAQKQYNLRSNEFRAALDDSTKDKISRTEAGVSTKALEDKLESRFGTLAKQLEDFKREMGTALDGVRRDIAVLREGAATGAGGASRHQADRLQSNWAVGLAVGIALAILTSVVGILLSVLR